MVLILTIRSLFFQVSIQGKNGNGGPRGDIAIDNVYVEHDKCKTGKTTTLTILTKDLNCKFLRLNENDGSNTSEYIGIMQCPPYIVMDVFCSLNVVFSFSSFKRNTSIKYSIDN